MTESVEYKVLVKIKKSKKGTLFFIEDFLEIANTKTVGKALERLVKKKEVSRISMGIYARLKKNSLFGEVKPDTEEIVKAIARRDKARIIPSGVLALNALHLSTQIPMKLVYLTDGTPRIIKVGKQTIKFKKTSPKNLATKGRISSLVILALKEIGKGNVADHEKEIIFNHLKMEEKRHLEHDIQLAPEWIRIILRELLKKL